MISLSYIIVFVAVAFLFYGLSCLFSVRLVKEFERYGLSRYRVLTGILQLLGAVGLLTGFLNAWIGLSAAMGLSLLMLAGFVTRLKIRDSFWQTMPSFFFMLLNAYIAHQFYLLIQTISAIQQ